MKEIKLTKGYVVIVDDEDFEELNKYKWYAHKASDGNIYAARIMHMHNVIMKNNMKVSIVDHIDGNGLDNRKINLRISTQKENMRNQRKKKIHRGVPTTSKFKGVSLNRKSGKYVAAITCDGIYHYLGTYIEEKEAAIAYNNGASKYFGQYAVLNII